MRFLLSCQSAPDFCLYSHIPSPLIIYRGLQRLTLASNEGRILPENLMRILRFARRWRCMSYPSGYRTSQPRRLRIGNSVRI